MLFSFETLQQLFPNGEGENKFTHINEIVLDSREVSNNGLFIPIVGERFNAHDFIEQAINNGVVATLWERDYPVPNHLKEKCYFFFVNDTIVGLQQLANYYRKEINPTVIGITGSNGKTSTKDLVSAVLQTTYKTHYTKGNYNNHIGLPLTILQMQRDTEVLVVEMGMSDFGEINRLTSIAEPDYAIITNIGESHIEYLGSREGIAKAKLEILNSLSDDGTIIVDGDELLLRNLPTKHEVIYCGFSMKDENSYDVTDVSINLDSTTFSVQNERYTIPLVGKHHAKNAAYAIAIAKKLKVSETDIQKGFNQVEHSGMRFEQLVSKRGAVIINDAYNASPTSMIGAIEVIKSLSNFKKKILVLGDIFELGERAEAFHKQIAESIDDSIDFVFTLGENASIITSEIIKRNSSTIGKHFESKDALIYELTPLLGKNVIVLFKASRGMAFEKMVSEIISA